MLYSIFIHFQIHPHQIRLAADLELPGFQASVIHCDLKPENVLLSHLALGGDGRSPNEIWRF